MISHELSTIQQNSQRQAWLQSCPGYITPAMEGLNEPFRAPYLPVHTWKGKKRNRSESAALKQQNRTAELAEQIRALVDQGCGITEIYNALKIDSRRMHAIAKEYGIKLQSKLSQRASTNAEIGRKQRALLLDKVRPLAEAGLAIVAIAAQLGCGRHVVKRIIAEYNIQRGNRRNEV